MSGSSINNSKLVSYQILLQQDTRNSKLVTYQLLNQVDIRNAKLVTYQVLNQVDIRVSKVVTYLILTPQPPPAPSPISVWAKRQLPTDNRLKNIRPRTQFYDNTTNKNYIDVGVSSDNYVFSSNSPITLSDNVVYSDTIVISGSVAATLADNVTSGDSLGNQANVPITFNDSVLSNDSLGNSSSLSAALSDSVSSNDLVFVQYFGNLTDNVLASETLGVSFLASASLLDQAFASDQLQSPKVVFANVVKFSLISGNSSVALAFDNVKQNVLLSAGSSSSTQIDFASVNKIALIQTIPGFGPIPVFPSIPQDFPIKVSPVMDTTLGTTKSLREIRFPQQNYPLWDIELSFSELVDQTQNQMPYGPFVGYTQFQQLVQLWLSMYGQTQVFAFNCPWDNSRANQLIGTGDGKTYVFTVVRTWGLGNQATTAPVGMVNSVFGVYVNGVLVPSSNYFIARDKIYFIDQKGFLHPPALNQTITMTFSYYYLCRFVEDEQDFEEFSKNRWNVGSLKFRAVIWI